MVLDWEWKTVQAQCVTDKINNWIEKPEDIISPLANFIYNWSSGLLDLLGIIIKIKAVTTKAMPI